ncbi:hypothetical protein [Cellulomonas composti]|uniref:Uncharacterized protein n=1 Tax=Cellulomonas composti TaxID=266130 RepID=A0A511JDG4_9CELL|nr:hypothetical protein [Cellulomonas composti]GEL96038.1 hypothetical protein CCO02nite_26960 [Cellulomonas composti]
MTMGPDRDAARADAPGADAPDEHARERSAWRPTRRDVLWLVVGALGALGLGFSVGTAVVIGVGVAATAMILARSDIDEDVAREQEHRRRRDGARGDLQDLSWAMVGRDGQVGERALRRVREIAGVRLARHGADLNDPDDADRVRALVGERARRTLLRRSAPLPSVADLRHTLEALETLGPVRTAPPPTTDPHTVPEPASAPAPAPDRRTS